MSDQRIRVTVMLEPHLAAYAERLVEVGKAPSVSTVVNDALEARRQRDQKARRLWLEAAERADPDKVARMIAHVEAQATQLPASHRYLDILLRPRRRIPTHRSHAESRTG